MDLKQEQESILKAFRMLDKDNNGLITKQEVIDFIKSNQRYFSEHEPEDYLKELDFAKGEYIDYSMFMTGMFNFKKYLNQEIIKKMFDLIDTNKDGQITEEELGKFLHFNDDQKDFLKELMEIADENKNGIITLQEFQQALFE